MIWFKKKIEGKTAKEWCDTGIALCRSGESYEEAMTCFDRALELDPDCKWAKGDISGPLFDALIQVLDDEKKPVRRQITRLMAELAEKYVIVLEVAPSLIRCLSDSDAEVRANAANAFAEITFTDIEEEQQFVDLLSIAVQPLVNCLSDADSEVRAGAANALGEIAFIDFDTQPVIDLLSRALQPLIHCLSDPDSNVRYFAASAISNFSSLGITDTGAVQPLIRIVSDDEGLEASAASNALGKLAEAGIIETVQAYDALEKAAVKDVLFASDAFEEVEKLSNANPHISRKLAETPMVENSGDFRKGSDSENKMSSGLSISRETEFFEGYIRLKMSVSNGSSFVITDSSLDFDFDDKLLRMDRQEPDYQVKNGKIILGNITGNSSKTVTIYFDPMMCSKGTDINCLVNYKDAKGQLKTTRMEPKKISLVCPIMETQSDINIGRLKEFIEKLPHKDSKVYQLQAGFDTGILKNICREVVQKHDVKHIRTLSTDDGKVCEIWYYGKTKVKYHDIVIKISILGETQSIELFAATQTAESLAGLLAEVGRELKSAVEAGTTGKGGVQQVINVSIRDSIVQRSNLLSFCDFNGDCRGDIVIEDSFIQGSGIGCSNAGDSDIGSDIEPEDSIQSKNDIGVNSCPACGEVLPDGAKFCMECGEKLV